jgi:P-type E1-E2 ATPase
VIEIEIPGWRCLRLVALVLDVNGTLSLDGDLLPGVASRIENIGQRLDIHLLSADTFGKAGVIAQELGVVFTTIDPRTDANAQKKSFVQKLGPSGVVAIGNGANDVEMLRTAELGIAVLGPEGTASAALLAADVVSRSIAEALDLLISPRRLTASLRR